jgi:hypothetical protein
VTLRRIDAKSREYCARFWLCSLDLLCVSLLAAVHGVHVTGDVHLKKEAAFAFWTLEILAHARFPVSTSGRSDPGLVQSGESIADACECPRDIVHQPPLSIREATFN